MAEDTSQTLAARTVTHLLSFGPVRARRMFGGWGIFHEDLMFALVAQGTLYLKVDDETAPRFIAAGCPPFTYARRDGARVVMSYRRAPDETAADPDALRLWAGWALAAARRARARKPRRKRHRPFRNPPS